MTDLSATYSEVRSLPDSALHKELNKPSGLIPGYMILAELNERRSVRQSAPTNMVTEAVQKYAYGGKVEAEAKINPLAVLMRGMKNFHSVDANPAVTDGNLPALPELGPAMTPMGLASLVPMRPGAPEQKFARGGIVALLPYQQAFMDAIAAKESGGRYNVMYGGKTFSDYSRHPGVAVPIQSGPNKGKTSSAAGKYQFLGSTWEDQAKKLGLTDFSPASQDAAAWNLAKESYNRGGRNLDAVLASGDPYAAANAAGSLRSIWTSLPGGIEQGTNFSNFANTYAQALGNPSAAVAPVSPAALAAATASAAPVAAATEVAEANPMAGLMALMAASQQEQAPAPAPAAPVRRAAPTDPDAVMEATSFTPEFYKRRRRNG